MADRVVLQVLLGAVSNLIVNEYHFLRGVGEQIKQLENDLEWMKLEVKEANKNSKSDDSSMTFARQMRNIIYDTENVIGKVIVRIVNHKRQRHSKARAGVNYITGMPFRHGLGNRIGEINTRIEKLRQRYKTTGGGGGGTESSNRGHSSQSLPQKVKERRAEIYTEIRRQQEPVQMYESTKKQVINLLLGDESDDGKKLRVISILGMGGVGKTTLCQKVFNDGDVVEKFQCRGFVYISDHYRFPDLPNLLKRIMESFGFVDSDGEVTSEKVRAYLENRTYLIVLDDLWDADVLKHLKDAFPDAKNGSRLLLTTRHKHIGLLADESSAHADILELSALNDETESWELFRQSYRPLWSPSINYQSYISENNLVNLRNTMLNKCHGLPLAIVVLGGILSLQVKELHAQPVWSTWNTENDRSSWLSTQGENSYKCLGILALSYDYLPYHLKPCFLYMSLFPGNRMIRVTKLFQYWIAEGLIIKNEGQMLEDTAQDYLDELIRRSLIQVGERRCDGRVKTCHVHGLLHGISASESTDDDFSETYGSINEFIREDNNSRRVAVYCEKRKSNKSAHPIDKSRIRCVICHEDVSSPINNYFNSFIRQFKYLRVLELNCYTGIDSLPKELGKLIHLRYLSLEKTKLKEINTSYLSNLVHLQTLYLRGSHELELDDQIWCLSQLRHLYLINIRPAAHNRRHHQGLSAADKLGISNLEELQLLVIRSGDWIRDGGLEKLSSLRKLRITECSSVHTQEISSAVTNLTNLHSLALVCKTPSEPVNNEAVPLVPIQFPGHTSLISLHLKGSIEHRWTGGNSFPRNICKLKLERSWIAEDPMPVLENLRSLRILYLGFESYLGKEMRCSQGGFFSLQTLELDKLLSLEEWMIEEGALPSLATLKVTECKNLKQIPDGLQQLTTLKKLRVANMPQLKGRMANIGEDWHKIQHIPSIILLA